MDFFLEKVIHIAYKKTLATLVYDMLPCCIKMCDMLP